MSNADTQWMARLGMRHPIIQAPMAGTSTPALATAVSAAGALGSLGIGASGVEQARGIVNRLHALGARHGQPLPDYPRAYDAGKALHQAASSQGSFEYAAHWAGQGAPLAREMPAADLVGTLARELAQALAFSRAPAR